MSGPIPERLRSTDRAKELKYDQNELGSRRSGTEDVEARINERFRLHIIAVPGHQPTLDSGEIETKPIEEAKG